jgi:glutamate-1-semialdehyde 2,1-aminomutase
MLKRGYLSSTNFYASMAHNTENIDKYGEQLKEVFGLIQKCENGEIRIDDLLEGPVCHSGFKRLN